MSLILLIYISDQEMCTVGLMASCFQFSVQTVPKYNTQYIIIQKVSDQSVLIKKVLFQNLEEVSWSEVCFDWRCVLIRGVSWSKRCPDQRCVLIRNVHPVEYIVARVSHAVSTLATPKVSHDARDHYLGLLYPSEQYKVWVRHGEKI